MTTALIWSAACLSALAAPAVLAQPAPAPVAVRGRVLAAENDRVLPRARVVVSVDGRQAESVFTDDRGRFTLPVVSGFSRTGATLVVTKAGYAIQHLTIAPSSTAKDVTVRLAGGAAVTGRVADPNGEGAVDVRVTATRQEPAPGDPTPVTFETISDDLGEYRFGGLPAGRYELRVNPRTEPTRLDLRPGDEIASINFSVLVNEGVPLGPRDSASTGPFPGQAGRGAISGRVLSAAGRPIASARVRALRNGLSPRGTTADLQGRFTIAELPAGSYTLEASRNGYVTVRYGQERAAQPGKQVLVRDEATASDIHIELPRGTAVTGTIVDEHGEPLQGVSVRAMQLRYVSGRVAALNAGSRDRRTDDRGRYRIYGLLPGSYLIVASADAPISGADARGYAPVFHPGTTQAADASPIVADLGRDVSAIDLVLTQTPAARVAASVRTSDGTPFAGNVLLMASQRSGAVAVEPLRSVPGADGSFVFANVPPGDYVVQAMRARGQSRGFFEFGVQALAVVDGDPKPVVVLTSPGSTLTGHVVEDDSGSRSASARRPRLVTPFPTDFDRAPAIGDDTFSISMGADGAFTMAGLFGPTRFRLSSSGNAYLESVTIGGLDVTDVPYDFGISPQTVTGAEITISNGGAAVSGHVTDASSAPVSNYSVVVFPTDRSKWFVASRFLRLARPTQDGSFEITGLPPGEYWVAATEPMDGTDLSGDWLKPETLEQLSFRATRVTLMEKERFTTVLRLIRR